MPRPGGDIPSREAWWNKRIQRGPQTVTDSFVDQVPVETQGQSTAQCRILKWFRIAQQRDVADHESRPLSFPQASFACHAIQGQALILVDRVREKNIHFPTAHRPEQGGRIAEIDQIEPCIAGRSSPVVPEGFQTLLNSSEAGQLVGPGADESVIEKSVLMVPVGRGRHRGEVGGGQKILKRARGSAQAQAQSVGLRRLNRGDAIADHVTESADLQKSTQAEGHRLRIKTGAVMEEHVLPQWDRDSATSIADLRER